jgi:RNA polymerase sigma-70 factor (ECF subfamily)
MEEGLPAQVEIGIDADRGRYQHTGASFVAWLLKIAHNLAMSLFRQARDVDYLEIDLAGDDRWADPEGRALAQHDRLAVRRAILRLRPEQQQVITMRFLEYLEYADIAAALGKSEGNVRVIQHRALAELRRLLTMEVKE